MTRDVVCRGSTGLARVAVMEQHLASLPAPMAPIIGREFELALARRLIERDRVRLVTLTGPAGVGKTRLALEIASECAPWFDGRVSFIALAALSETRLLLRAIASALSVTDSVDPVTGIRRQLRDSANLLVLDNLEQLPDAGIELVRLLHSARGLTILATSRAPLEVYGESVLPVEPLPIPNANDRQLATNPAVRMLMASAHSARATFEFPLADYPLLAAIAHRVDGLPLALELAGAYLPLLGARGVLDALKDRLSVLGGGPHGLPSRLQTMRDAIAWSYDLLSPEEQALFRRLSVFTGGFTFEMAEAMTRGWQPEDGYPYLFGLPMWVPWMAIGKEAPSLGHGDWRPAELPPIAITPLAGLESLAQQSLLRPLRSESGVERFEQLETIREYGLEQLEIHKETEATRSAQAVLVTEIAELCWVAMWGPDWRPAISWIEAELPNIRGALAWLATQPSEANQIRLRLLDALWPFWQSRGYATEGCAHLEAALTSPGGTPAARAAALNLLGLLSWLRNDLERAAAVLDEALPVLQQIGYETGLGRNFLYRALLSWSLRDFERMEKMAAIARKHFADAPDSIGLPMSLLVLGIATREQQDAIRANDWFTLAYRGFAREGFTWGMGATQYYLGELARQEGDRVRAVSNLRWALEMMVDIGDPWSVGGCVGTLAIYLVRDGAYGEAARLFGAAQGLESSHGIFLPLTEAARHEAAAHEVRTKIGAEEFARLFAEGEKWPLPVAAAHAMQVPLESALESAEREAASSLVADIPPLPERSLRTLHMRAAGRSVKEIALEEGITVSSVYERFDRIKEQLGLDPHVSHAEIMVHAVRVGIV